MESENAGIGAESITRPCRRASACNASSQNERAIYTEIGVRPFHQPAFVFGANGTLGAVVSNRNKPEQRIKIKSAQQVDVDRASSTEEFGHHLNLAEPEHHVFVGRMTLHVFHFVCNCLVSDSQARIDDFEHFSQLGFGCTLRWIGVEQVAPGEGTECHAGCKFRVSLAGSRRAG